MPTCNAQAAMMLQSSQQLIWTSAECTLPAQYIAVQHGWLGSPDSSSCYVTRKRAGLRLSERQMQHVAAVRRHASLYCVNTRCSILPTLALPMCTYSAGK
jgi:hypothetical protein